MRRKFRRKLRFAMQVCLWLFSIYLGINIIAKGSMIIYGEPFEQIMSDTLQYVGRKLGQEIIKRSGMIFSYINEDDTDKDNVTRFVERMYLWRTDTYDKVMEYPAEDNVYDKLIAGQMLENMLEKSTLLENDIPVISCLPDYVYQVIGEGDSGELVDELQPGEDDAMEAVGDIVPAIKDVLKPEIIGNEYSVSQLRDFDFLLRKFYAVESNTTINTSILNVEAMFSYDASLEKKDGTTPQILIYHTHSTEGYSDSREGVAEDTVVGMGSYLAEILERDYGYGVIHVTTPFDCLNGKLDRSAAYAYAEGAIDGILKTYPDIEVIIDLHRDGVNDDVRLVTEYNGKKAAKIMFVNGISRMENKSIGYLYNPNLEGNLAFSFQLQLKGEAYFPGLMRRIIIKAYRYNLHYEPRSVLVELGAQTNTVEEARNSVELLAFMIGEVLK